MTMTVGYGRGYVDAAENKKLLECDGIPITEKELEKINEIENLPDLTGAERKALQRLLFTTVVLGKYQNLKSNNYGYISSKFLQIKTIDLFKIARVSANKQERLLLLNQLYNHKFIEFPKSYKDNCRATFLDDETTTKMIISIASGVRPSGLPMCRPNRSGRLVSVFISVSILIYCPVINLLSTHLVNKTKCKDTQLFSIGQNFFRKPPILCLLPSL